MFDSYLQHELIFSLLLILTERFIDHPFHFIPQSRISGHLQSINPHKVNVVRGDNSLTNITNLRRYQGLVVMHTYFVTYFVTCDTSSSDTHHKVTERSSVKIWVHNDAASSCDKLGDDHSHLISYER